MLIQLSLLALLAPALRVQHGTAPCPPRSVPAARAAPSSMMVPPSRQPPAEVGGPGRLATQSVSMADAMALLDEAGNRPLSLRVMGPAASQWLQREMRWLAGDFLLMMEEESLGWVSSAEELPLIRMAAQHYAPAGLQRHLLRRLAESPPRTGALANATMASGHAPTVWCGRALAPKPRAGGWARPVIARAPQLIAPGRADNPSSPPPAGQASPTLCRPGWRRAREVTRRATGDAISSGKR